MINFQATPIWRLLIDPHIACCAGNNNISISSNSSCPMPMINNNHQSCSQHMFGILATHPGALVVANICLAFLEPTISKWMHETMDAEEWQQVSKRAM